MGRDWTFAELCIEAGQNANCICNRTEVKPNTSHYSTKAKKYGQKNYLCNFNKLVDLEHEKIYVHPIFDTLKIKQ